MYFAKYTAQEPNFDDLEAAPINQYPWGGDYRPKAEARLAFVAGRGFALRMTCAEDAPPPRYTKPNDPVYKDSCMEFFLDCYPELGAGYFNFECNAAGAMLCGFGAGKQGRISLRAPRGAELPQPQPLQSPGMWGFTLLLPLSLIQDYYGRNDFDKGSILEGNFYKCGDETPQPHYGCWSKISAPSPNFHLPRYFGQIVIS